MCATTVQEHKSSSKLRNVLVSQNSKNCLRNFLPVFLSEDFAVRS